MQETPSEAGVTLEAMRFDNLVLRSLPVDTGPNTVRQVRGACFSRVAPEPLAEPRIVAVSPEALRLLDLDPQQADRPEFTAAFSGNHLLPGMEPAAHCYCGFQFGYFSGQLGDGAAMYLGELVNSRGERWELQLKGAGLTPYSRQADGRKVLRSSIREFLCSEAMHFLHIPTTRAASVVTSDSRVTRDVHYTGDPIQERCSVVSRLAPSFLRFGSFEIFKKADPVTGREGPSAADPYPQQLLPQLLDFTIRTYFPEVWAAHNGSSLAPGPLKQDMYAVWFTEVVRRTARLVAAWQCVGFCHGVLNTDNMSILGLTLDYGPFQFLDRYDPGHVCNGSDDTGRYNFAAQPEICRWNCEKLAEALSPLLPPSRSQAALYAFHEQYDEAYRGHVRRKLGLLSLGLEAREQRGDRRLVEDLLQTMQDTGADFTNTWRALALFPMPPPAPSAAPSDAASTSAAATGSAVAGAAAAGASAADRPAAAAGAAPASSTAAATPPLELAGPFPDGGALDAILASVADVHTMAAASASRIPPENLQMLVALSARDPMLLITLGTTQAVLMAEVQRNKVAERWRATTQESKAAADRERWSTWLQQYGVRLQLEAAAGTDPKERVRIMNSSNPRYVLRNWIAQSAIEQAEGGDFTGVQRVLQLLTDPFACSGAAAAAAAEAAASAGQAAAQRASTVAAPVAGAAAVAAEVAYDSCPAWAAGLCVTCSS